MNNPLTTPTNTPFETAIATVQIDQQIVETSAFQNVLNDIPRHIDRANQLLADYRADKAAFIENVDEDALANQMKDMKEVTVFIRDIEKSKKEIKKFLKEYTDGVMSTLDERLVGARFNELSQADSDMKQLKKDIENDRREQRWLEIKATFDANIDRYPLLTQYANALTDFSKFKILYPSLVSGAKSRNLREADFTTVNQTVYGWNEGLKKIVDNSWGLDRLDANRLLEQYVREPSLEMVDREGPRLKANADERLRQEAEAKARKAEADRLAELEREAQAKRLHELQQAEAKARAERDALALERSQLQLAEEQKRQAEEQKRQVEEQARLRQLEAERQAQYSNFNGQYSVKMRESYPRFMEYMFGNPKYHDLHTNVNTKAAVVYDIMHQLDRPDSVVTLETQRDPQAVIDLVRYMLDA